MRNNNPFNNINAGVFNQNNFNKNQFNNVFQNNFNNSNIRQQFNNNVNNNQNQTFKNHILNIEQRIKQECMNNDNIVVQNLLSKNKFEIEVKFLVKSKNGLEDKGKLIISKNFPNEKPVVFMNNFLDPLINKNSLILNYEKIPGILKTKIINLIQSIRNYFIQKNIQAKNMSSFEGFANDLNKIKNTNLVNKIKALDDTTIDSLIKEQDLRINYIISFDEFQVINKKIDDVKNQNKKISNDIIVLNNKINSMKEDMNPKLAKFEKIIFDLQNNQQNYLLLKERFTKNNLIKFLFESKEELMKQFKELELKLKKCKDFEEYNIIIDEIKKNKTNIHYYHILYQKLGNMN